MLNKLTIIAYKDRDLTEEFDEGRFEVQVNPESYSQKYEVRLEKSQGAGTSAAPTRFSSIAPEEISLDFLFDATGAIEAKFNRANGVGEPLAALKRLLYEFHGETHEPNYVKLLWGDAIFKGRLASMEISYKLFNEQGVPIRAVARCSFVSSVSDELRIAKEDAQSSDITHARTIEDGDTLPGLCHEIYGDSVLYLEVAEFNRLTDFRSLETGAVVEFPPLEK